jgi:hypothetical protein
MFHCVKHPLYLVAEPLQICKLGLKAKILTHIRCNMEDAKVACATGVDGVDVGFLFLLFYLASHSQD